MKPLGFEMKSTLGGRWEVPDGGWPHVSNVAFLIVRFRIDMAQAGAKGEQVVSPGVVSSQL